MMKRFVDTTLLLLLGATALFAQDTIPSAITPMNNTGELPYSTTIGSDVEHIDLASGNLIVNIPFVSVPGRKMSFDFGIRYDSRFWIQDAIKNVSFWNIEQRNWLTKTTLGWTPMQGYLTYTYGNAYCVASVETTRGNPIYYGGGIQGNGYIFTDRHGNKHSFLVNQYRSGECLDSGAFGNPFDSSNYVGPSPDMDGYYASFSGPLQTPTIQGPDGTYYDGGGTSGGTSYGSREMYFTDRATERDLRGNSQTISPGGQDSIGRTLVTQQVSADQIVYSIPDSSGTTQSYTVNLETISVTSSFGASGVAEASATRQVVNSVALPNGQSYGFQYDTWGDIREIDLPTGASVIYEWSTINVEGQGEARAVTKRSVTHDKQTDVWTISYADLSTNSVTVPSGLVTVTAPADANGSQAQTVYSYDLSQHLTKIQYLASPGGKQLLQYDLTWDSSRIDPSGSVTENSLLTSIQTTTSSGLVNLKQFQYDLYTFPYQTLNCGDESSGFFNCVDLASGHAAINGVPFDPQPPTYLPSPTWWPGSHGNVTTIQEYDWGQGTPGPLVRQTIRQYLHDVNSNYFIAQPITSGTTGGSTLRNIADHVASETIYDGSAVCSGTGTWSGDVGTPGAITPPAACKAKQLAQTTVIYDNGNPDTYGYYGEPTSISKWLNLPSSTMLTTTYSYDGYGNIILVKDPKGSTTGYDYTDAWTGSTACQSSSSTSAYVTTITNALSQKTKATYYACTGKLAAHLDPNDIALGRSGTTYAYDLMGRTTSVSYPDGGNTTTTYDDSAHTVDVKQLLSAGNVHEVLTQLDMLGRTIQTQVLSDPYGVDYVDTNYDSLGRTYTVSNPYRAKTDNTYGITTHYYDALGRKTAQTNPDGSTQQWCYNSQVTEGQTNCTTNLSAMSTGTWIDFSDERGKHWQRISDAFGRLTAVIEDADNVKYETDYQYDVLGNLTFVNQKGNGGGSRTRSFNYDSLSRLLCASNPETSTASCPTSALSGYVAGTVGYVYDANGNVSSKTDARSTTISYSYDALNRLLSKSYSDGSTSLSCYQYDSSSVTNGIGRLSNEWTQGIQWSGNNASGKCTAALPATGGYLTAKSISAYDPMGRTWSEQQCTLTGCRTANPCQTASGSYQSYSYDLAGHLTCYSSLFPVPALQAPVTISQSFDSAGRLQTVSSSWNDSVHPPCLFMAQASSSSPCTQTTPQPAYAPFGGLMNALFGSSTASGVSLTRSYDNRLRVSGETDTGYIP